VLLASALTERAYGNIFNLGTGKATSFIELAKIITKVSGSGGFKFTEFSKERKEIEPGDYYADITKIRKIVGWAPLVDLETGIKKTIDYYRKYKDKYW
jgi:nucleoside-diphosphate-sugar epimerase